MTKEGAMAHDAQPLTQPQPTGKPNPTKAQQKNTESSDDAEENARKQMEQELHTRENARFQKTKEDIEKAMQQSAELKALAQHLKIDITPEGLRIQIIDQDGDPMFPSGSAAMYDKTRKLMGAVAQLIQTLPNGISVRGHTDSHPYAAGADYTNWELSSDRANATRRILQENGIPEKRLSNVMGKADTEPFIPKDPMDARNRRMSIILLRETLEEAVKRGEFGSTAKLPEPQQPPVETAPAPVEIPVKTYQKTQGAVQFP
jgi:chemotaxis protein MotB